MTAATPAAGAAFEQAKLLFLEGLAALQAGRPDDAERSFLASLEALPGRVSTLVNLAATRLVLGRPQEALQAADQVLAAEPDNLDGWYHRGTALARLGRVDEALAACDRALAIDPGFVQVWTHRGSLLRETGRLDDAAHAFRRALALGGDGELNGYYLASVAGGARPPPAPPGHYVQALFDDYAERFDDHLVQALGYRGHQALIGRLAPPAGGRFRSALDLGCGTGLCGPLLRPIAERLAGVDISGGMLAKARALGVYDALAQADAVEHLRTGAERHDLIVAADVFIYLGDPAPVLAAAHAALDPGGLFCFSAERAEDGDDERGFVLLPSLRYAHAEASLRRLAARHGFDVAAVRREPLREEQRRAIDGLYVYLRRH